MSATRATALPICVAILLAATSATAADVIPTALSMKKVVNWGYGCGGHCAFNHRGSSSVAVEFLSGGSVRVTDAGSGEATMNHPEGSTFTTRRWDHAWKGVVRDAGGTQTMDLKPGSSRCEETVSSGRKREMRPCHASLKDLTVVCTREKVNVHAAVPVPGKKPHASEKDAMVCRPAKDATGHPGTEFPWVFGMGGKITTNYTGEPHAETSYTLEK
jgi:hypothetical protein